MCEYIGWAEFILSTIVCFGLGAVVGFALSSVPTMDSDNGPKKIHIERFGGTCNEFKVYSDLGPWKISQIPGVHNVSDVLEREEGYLVVTVDKRFNVSEVVRQIKELA